MHVVYEVTDAAEMQRSPCWIYLGDTAHAVGGRETDTNPKQADLGSEAQESLKAPWPERGMKQMKEVALGFLLFYMLPPCLCTTILCATCCLLGCTTAGIGREDHKRSGHPSVAKKIDSYKK
jgi:hypothetical protein